MTDKEMKLLRCSFCSRSTEELNKLVCGPAVFICDDCIWLCVDVLKEDEAAKAKERK